MQSGLKVIFNENLPDYELSFVVLMMSSPLQLRRAVLVVADISGEIAHPEPSASVITPSTQYRDIHWVLWSATASIRWPLSY